MSKVPPIPPEEEIRFMHIDETDFSSMSRAEQIRHLEVEGYVAFPSILRPDIIARIKSELADAEMLPTSYSAYQTRSVTQPQWVSRAAAELIGYPPIVEFLRDLVGPDIVFTRGFFQRTLPGSPGISIHTDGQPHGSNLFGYEGSCPRLLRVLYYLDDLTRTRAPFRLIPRSHLSFHADASPYVRYRSHPEEITLVVPAARRLSCHRCCCTPATRTKIRGPANWSATGRPGRDRYSRSTSGTRRWWPPHRISPSRSCKA